MYKLINIVSFLLCMGEITHAQQTFNITTSFGVDILNNIVEVDSGYFTVCTNGLSSGRKAVLCFYDSAGNLQWNRTYGDSLKLYHDYSLIKTEIGNLTMGSAFSYLPGKYAFALRKVSPIGDSIWFHSFVNDSLRSYHGYWVTSSQDNGYLISGAAIDSTNGNIYVLKTDSAGTFQWDYELNGVLNDQGYDASETVNHDFLIVGYTRSFGNGNANNHDAIIVAIDSTGNYKWKKTFGVSNFTETFFHIVSTTNNKFLISGGKGNQNGFANAGIWKIDSSGNQIWQKYFSTLSNLSIFYGIHELPNGNIVTVGSDRDTATHKDQGWIVILDSLGKIIKQRRMSVGNDHCIFNDVKQTKDGGFIIAGYVFGGPNGEDGWLVKLDSNLCDVSGCAANTAIHEMETNYSSAGNVIVYPNPCTDNLFIKPDFGISIRSATVYDLSGKEIITSTYSRRELFQISTGNLAPGIYFAKLKTDTGEQVVKFIRQ